MGVAWRRRLRAPRNEQARRTRQTQIPESGTQRPLLRSPDFEDCLCRRADPDFRFTRTELAAQQSVAGFFVPAIMPRVAVVAIAVALRALPPSIA
jgi:hypothetical protein